MFGRGFGLRVLHRTQAKARPRLVNVRRRLPGRCAVVAFDCAVLSSAVVLLSSVVVGALPNSTQMSVLR